MVSAAGSSARATISSGGSSAGAGLGCSSDATGSGDCADRASIASRSAMRASRIRLSSASSEGPDVSSVLCSSFCRVRRREFRVSRGARRDVNRGRRSENSMQIWRIRLWLAGRGSSASWVVSMVSYSWAVLAKTTRTRQWVSGGAVHKDVVSVSRTKQSPGFRTSSEPAVVMCRVPSMT